MLDPNVEITTLELDGFPPAVLRPVIFARSEEHTSELQSR